MPITKFQRYVLRLLAKNRSPDSYVAGATVVNRHEDSPRYSSDIDFFHDPSTSVQVCANLDLKTLRDDNLKVSIVLEQRGFVRSIVESASESLKLEWVSDSAFRFYPVLADDDLGYRLHDIDSAINKCLALANRTEVRDLIDIIEIDRRTLCLSACCWAACAKDPGFTPELILDCVSRNARLSPELLAAENLRDKIDPKELKKTWLEVFKKASSELLLYPAETLGCLFLDQNGEVIKRPKYFSKYKTHSGCVRGAWPVGSQ